MRLLPLHTLVEPRQIHLPI